MGPEKSVLIFLSIVVVFVPVIRAQDPLCDGLPADEIFPFPHETNCSLYYECFNGEKTEQACDNGLFYNPIMQTCDFPDVAGCTSTDPLCEGLPRDEIIPLPHEYNCSLYYECYLGQKTQFVCQDGLYYNKETQTCDFPEVSGCRNGDPLCAGVELDYLPHPSNCSMYIECYHGDSYVMACPGGFWFHSQEKRCVDPSDSDCDIRSTPPWTTPHPICWGVRPNEIVLKRYDGDCNKYWRCDGATLSVQSCPNNLFFNEEKQLCDFPETVDCDDSTKTPDPFSTTPISTLTPPTTPIYEEDPRCVDAGIAYWPHPASCSKYIECYHDVSYEMDCPDGLYYSDAVKRCVPASEAECTKTTTPGGTTRTPPTDFTADPDCPYPESEGKLLPYPGDCTQYYECAEGKKVALPCPSGLWFNPNISQCDYPYQANCEWGNYTFQDLVYSYFMKIFF